MVSSPSRGRSKEPGSSMQSKSSSMASTRLSNPAAKSFLHHTPTRLGHHSAHNEKSVERSQQSILNAQQTLNPAYRQSRLANLSDSMVMTESSYLVPSNTSRLSIPRSASDNTSSYVSTSTSYSGEPGSGMRFISSVSHSGEPGSVVRVSSLLSFIRESLGLGRVPSLLTRYPPFLAHHPKRDD